MPTSPSSSSSGIGRRVSSCDVETALRGGSSSAKSMYTANITPGSHLHAKGVNSVLEDVHQRRKQPDPTSVSSIELWKSKISEGRKCEWEKRCNAQPKVPVNTPLALDNHRRCKAAEQGERGFVAEPARRHARRRG